MTYSPSPSRNPTQQTDGPISGVVAIANFIGAPRALTERALQSGALKATRFGGDWTADRVDLETARVILYGPDRRQPHYLPGGPAAYPSKASFE